MSSGEYPPFAVTQEKPNGPKLMQFALIFIFFEAGIFDTGLRYESFEACSKAAIDFQRSVQAIPEDRFNHSPFNDGVAKCVPSI